MFSGIKPAVLFSVILEVCLKALEITHQLYSPASLPPHKVTPVPITQAGRIPNEAIHTSNLFGITWKNVFVLSTLLIRTQITNHGTGPCKVWPRMTLNFCKRTESIV